MVLISVVIPVYNEQSCLPALFEKIQALAENSQDSYEFLFVDDGSTDGSRAIIKQMQAKMPSVRYFFFSRNFGHEAATTAGLDHARGDVVTILDADLQEPPELITQLVDKWRQGYDVVYARRQARAGESLFKKATAWCFYRLIRRLSGVDIPPDTGDFRIIDRKVVEAFRQCREKTRFVRGLLAWVGFKQTVVYYQRHQRLAGKTKYNLPKMFNLALDAILGFSLAPVRIVLFVGLAVALLSLAAVVLGLVLGALPEISLSAYYYLICAGFFLTGLQLSALALVGEYVGRTFRETQNRPIYILQETSDH